MWMDNSWKEIFADKLNFRRFQDELPQVHGNTLIDWVNVVTRLERRNIMMVLEICTLNIKPPTFQIILVSFYFVD